MNLLRSNKLVLIFTLASLAAATGLAKTSEPKKPQNKLTWNLPDTEKPAMEWLKGSGWEEQKGTAKHWRIGPEGLCTRQAGDSTTIGKKIELAHSLASPITLRASFKIVESPEGADLAKKKKEDSALRIFVLFRSDRGFMRPPDTIGYAHSASHPLGTWITSERFDNVKFLVVAHPTNAKEGLIEIERDLAADYKAAFGGELIPDIVAVALKSDANDVEGKARACLSSFELLSESSGK